MTRLVIPKRTGGATHRDVRRYEAEGDGYYDRVAKYIPAEVVAGYVSLDSIAKSQAASLPMVRSPAPDAVAGAPAAVTDAAPSLIASFTTLPGIVFFICLVLAPLYVWHMARRAGIHAWKMQALIATAAFVVWAYAIKGNVFFQNDKLNGWAQQTLGRQEFYDPQIGALLLILFSLLVAFYQPTEGES